MSRYLVGMWFTLALIAGNLKYDPCHKVGDDIKGWAGEYKEIITITLIVAWPLTLGAVTGMALREFHHERCTP